MTERIYDDTPPRFDIKIYKGSSFGKDWSIDIPDLSDQQGDSGPGPASLDETGVEVIAEVRYDLGDAEPAAEFDCIKLIDEAFTAEVDGVDVDFIGRVRPYLTRQQTAALTRDFGYWSIEVQWGDDDNEAILAGEVDISGDPTRDEA